MATHQASKACRAADQPRHVTFPADPVTSIVEPDEDPDVEPAAMETDHQFGDEDVSAEDSAVGTAELMKRACQRLDAVGTGAEEAERAWNNVRMVDEHGFGLTQNTSEAESDGEGTGTGEDADTRSNQRVLGDLSELMAPSDGSVGLTATQRKRLFTFADTCLTRGGSQLTISEILRSANPVSSKSSNSERLLEAYLDSLCSFDGWTEKTFDVVTGHIATTRWNSNIIGDLVSLVQDPQLFRHLRLRPEYDGERFNHPSTGLHMFSFYNLIKKQRIAYGDWDKACDVVLLLVFFSDATLLANKGSLSAHPVVLSVANLPPILATRNQVLLGFLSEFDKTRKENGTEEKCDFSMAENSELKRVLMAKQTAAMVAPLVKASYEGIPFVSPTDGRQMRMFPTLFCAPLDHPEICSHLGVKGKYCGICKWKSKGAEMAKTKTDLFRTEPDSIKFVEMVKKAPSRDIDALKKKQGAHGQRSGLWGFNGSAPIDALPASLSARTKRAILVAGSRTPWTDVHLAVAGEVMHEIDLGVLVYARKAVLHHLQVTLGKSDKEVEELNEALRLAMTHESRWPGLRYPPSKKETSVLQGYYGGTSRVEASEHRSVLQFSVPVLVRFLGANDPATRLMACVIKYYRARQVRPSDMQPGLRTHTKQSLRRVGELFSKMDSVLKEVDPPSAPEETPKMHQQSHFGLQVMRLGTTSITTGQAGEANNARIKSSVSRKRTNMQKGSVERTIVKLHRRSRAVGAAVHGGRISTLPASTKRYKTSEVLAAKNDFCVFSSQRNVRKNDRFTTVDIFNFVRTHIGSLERPRQMAQYDMTADIRRDMFDRAPVDSYKDQETALNKRLSLVFGDWTVAKAFLGELSFFLTGQNSKEPFSGAFDFTMKVVHTASNPSVLSHASRKDTTVRLLQRLRADPNFRGNNKMQFDFVAISAEAPHKGDDLWYARLILLFHIQDPSKPGKWRQLAFVRYLVRTEHREDELSRMTKDSEPDVTPLVYSHRQRKNKMVWYYGVCSVESIIRRVHVVAGNAEGSRSLRKSRGDRAYFQDDRRAKFFLNHNIFEAPTEPYFRPLPPKDTRDRNDGK